MFCFLRLELVDSCFFLILVFIINLYYYLRLMFNCLVFWLSMSLLSCTSSWNTQISIVISPTFAAVVTIQWPRLSHSYLSHGGSYTVGITQWPSHSGATQWTLCHAVTVNSSHSSVFITWWSPQSDRHSVVITGSLRIVVTKEESVTLLLILKGNLIKKS